MRPSSVHMESVSALRRSGRLSVTVTTAGSLRSRMMSDASSGLGWGLDFAWGTRGLAERYDVRPKRYTRARAFSVLCGGRLRLLGQLNDEAARGCRVHEHDAAVPVADHGFLRLEAYALLTQLAHG